MTPLDMGFGSVEHTGMHCHYKEINTTWRLQDKANQGCNPLVNRQHTTLVSNMFREHWLLIKWKHVELWDLSPILGRVGGGGGCAVTIYVPSSGYMWCQYNHNTPSLPLSSIKCSFVKCKLLVSWKNINSECSGDQVLWKLRGPSGTMW